MQYKVTLDKVGNIAPLITHLAKTDVVKCAMNNGLEWLIENSDEKKFLKPLQ